MKDLGALRAGYITGVKKRLGNVNRLGTILSSFGVTVIGAVGILRFADVFPYESPPYVAVSMGTGFVVMVVSAAVAALKLHKATLGSAMKSDPGQIPDLSAEEEEIVESVYSGVLISTDTSNMSAHEARGARLDRISDRMPEVAEELRSQAAVIDAELSYGFAQARYAILNRRAGRAIKLAGICTAIFLLGLGTVLVTIDQIESDRSEATKEAKTATLDPPAESFAEAAERVAVEKETLRVDKICAASVAAGVYGTESEPTTNKAPPDFCLPPKEPESPFSDWIEKNLPFVSPFLGIG